MSIKSDKWIESKCDQPTGVLFHSGTEAHVSHETYANASELKNYLYSPTQDGRVAEIISVVGKENFDLQRYRYVPTIAVGEFSPMISPFVPNQVRTRLVDDVERTTLAWSKMPQKEEKIVSFGLSSMGYDVRLDRKFKIFTNVKSALIDPLNMSDDCYVDHEGDFCIIPPNSYILGHTIETFDIPRDVMVVCLGKSTYARCGAIVNVTPIEPGFKGTVVIEISNSTPLPLKVYAGQGIAQFLFYQSDEECAVSYGDRNGKYQNQQGLVTARV